MSTGLARTASNPSPPDRSAAGPAAVIPINAPSLRSPTPLLTRLLALIPPFGGPARAAMQTITADSEGLCGAEMYTLAVALGLSRAGGRVHGTQH
jgi:hypothetical protein